MTAERVAPAVLGAASIATEGDRTLFFDFYPPPPARLLGVALHIQIYTASGGIQNDATRRSLLAGSDGILFIADSQRGRERLKRRQGTSDTNLLRASHLPHRFRQTHNLHESQTNGEEQSARKQRDHDPRHEHRVGKRLDGGSN